MLDNEDWLGDPLAEISIGSYKFRKLKNLPKEQQDQWDSFHYATRLKLEGADYFCRQVLGAASMPDAQGMPSLAYKQLKWFLDAFFFELMSAYDVLLQELNIVYAYDLGLKPEQVRWDTKKGKLLKDKLPKDLLEYMDKERKEKWFRKFYQHRNRGAHHSYLPVGSWRVFGGDEPWRYTEHGTNLFYFDPDTGKQQAEDVTECRNYLSKMIEHIHQVWGKMAQEFE